MYVDMSSLGDFVVGVVVFVPLIWVTHLITFSLTNLMFGYGFDSEAFVPYDTEESFVYVTTIVAIGVSSFGGLYYLLLSTVSWFS